MSQDKIKLHYAPSFFEDFDDSQAELDALTGKIEKLFSGKTAEGLEAMGEPMTEEYFTSLPEHIQAKLLAAIAELDDPNELKKKLN